MATSRELLIQLKSSIESNQTVDGQFERINLSVATYNYLWDQLQVVLIVKYVSSEQNAYWQLLSQIPEPDQSNETMTVKIPRSQTLNPESWGIIRRYIEDVHNRKLGQRRRVNLSRYA